MFVHVLHTEYTEQSNVLGHTVINRSYSSFGLYFVLVLRSTILSESSPKENSYSFTFDDGFYSIQG